MILVKTQAGQQMFKDRSVRLTPRQRSAFILFDGKRTIGDVLDAGMGIGQDDIDQMVELGMLGEVGDSSEPSANSANVVPSQPAGLAVVPRAAAPVAVSVTAPAPVAPVAATGRSTQLRYQEAYPIATRLTAGLGLRGFRLNLSVEGATTYEQLAALAPKIKAAVGDEKADPLERALFA
jgi:hypothetical protein